MIFKYVIKLIKILEDLTIFMTFINLKIYILI